MIKAKRYSMNRNFLSLLGMISFLLFATQVNYQYSSSADPSADAKDPVSMAARVTCTIRGTVGEHLPIVVEEPSLAAGRAQYHRVSGLPDQPLLVTGRALPSLRGPPCV